MSATIAAMKLFNGRRNLESHYDIRFPSWWEKHRTDVEEIGGSILFFILLGILIALV
jgi:hypothetical protein